MGTPIHSVARQRAENHPVSSWEVEIGIFPAWYWRMSTNSHFERLFWRNSAESAAWYEKMRRYSHIKLLRIFGAGYLPTCSGSCSFRGSCRRGWSRCSRTGRFRGSRSPTHQGRLWFRRYPRTTAGAPEELQLMDGRYLLLLRGFSISVPLPRLIFVPQNEWMGLAIHSVASILAKYRVLWTQNEQMGILIHSVASQQASKQQASQSASKQASKPSRKGDYLTLISSSASGRPSAEATTRIVPAERPDWITA